MKENKLIPPQARRPAAYRVIKETLLKYDITPDEFFSAKFSRRRGIKDLVAATHISGPQLRYNALSLIRANEEPNLLTKENTVAPFLLAILTPSMTSAVSPL